MAWRLATIVRLHASASDFVSQGRAMEACDMAATALQSLQDMQVCSCVQVRCPEGQLHSVPPCDTNSFWIAIYFLLLIIRSTYGACASWRCSCEQPLNAGINGTWPLMLRVLCFHSTVGYIPGYDRFCSVVASHANPNPMQLIFQRLKAD